MVEWLRHYYRAEGVSQFVLIDDQSTDGSTSIALAENKGDVVVVPAVNGTDGDQNAEARVRVEYAITARARTTHRARLRAAGLELVLPRPRVRARPRHFRPPMTVSAWQRYTG